MLVLFETSAGYAIFNITNEKKLDNVENIASMFETPEHAKKLYDFVNFLVLNFTLLKNSRTLKMPLSQLPNLSREDYLKT
jgi:hypothetical protein